MRITFDSWLLTNYETKALQYRIHRIISIRLPSVIGRLHTAKMSINAISIYDEPFWQFPSAIQSIARPKKEFKELDYDCGMCYISVII